MSAPAMVLMDRYLPKYQFEEHHSTVVHAAHGALLDAVQVVARETDPLINRLIAVREFPARCLRLLGRRHRLPSRPFGIEDFTELGREGNQELAFGLAGWFWQADYGLHRLGSAAEFETLQGTPKLVLKFWVEPLADGAQRLHTISRIYCPDDKSRRRFTPYWYLIRPVSGLIRNRLLNRVASRAQHATC